MEDKTNSVQSQAAEDHGDARVMAQIPSVPMSGVIADAEQQNVFGELEFTPDFRAVSNKASAVRMDWRNVNYRIGKKDILMDVSGFAEERQTCALMGPSGAGKSSLLNCLAGRISPNKKHQLGGSVYINNRLVSPLKFRKQVAYVMQEDALFATSTAREALEFSATLRLNKSITKDERDRLVGSLLDALGLRHVENTMCGSSLVRGLSGGEKKRVAIGVELVTNPRILFLDEPTSGLDSYSAWKVVMILNALAKSGCTVLCTIHQPSSEVFNLFNRVMVLNRGQVIYNGHVSRFEENLRSVGHSLPPMTNPADFIMVLAQTLKEDKMLHFEEDYYSKEAMDERKVGNSWRDASVKRVQAMESADAFEYTTGANYWLQMRLLAIREFKNLYRDKAALIGRFGITVFLNLLFGCIFFHVGDRYSPTYLLESHFGAIVNLYISAMFGAAQPPLLTFALERVVFLREYSTGTFSGAPYLLSKVMVEIPLYFVQALLVMVIVYWMMELSGNFFILMLEMFLMMVVAASYAFVMGALVTDVKQAQELSPLVFVPQLLFGGFFIRINQIPVWLRWIQYLCSLKYSINLASITEFGGNQCAISGNATLSAIRVAQCHQLLASNDVNENQAWLYVMILIIIFVGFRTMSCIALILRARNHN